MKIAQDHTQLSQFSLEDLASDEAAQTLRKQGCLQIKDFLAPSTVETLKTEILETYEKRIKDDAFSRVGHKRRMITLPICGALGDPAIYAPPPLIACLDVALGKDHIINCAISIISQPGSEAQHIHCDYQGLFHSPLDHLTPAFALNLFVPLVPLNEITGTTKMWPGSHLKPLENPEEHPGVCPNVSIGSALIMDYRVQHQGMANLSQDVRPIITLGFSRKWFFDTSNFIKIPPFDLRQDHFEAMEPAHQTLFQRAKLYF